MCGECNGIKTRAKTILELLEECGEVPDSLRSKIEAETDTETLKCRHKLAARVDSLEDFRAKMDAAVRTS